ncbi:hypothetical protein BJ912DRAFT_829011, partial [Pholiota molesta]
PPWLEDASKYLTEAVDSDIWKTFVADWIKFESEHGAITTTAHRMPAALRPGLLSNWIQKRRYDQIPSLPDVQVFADEWVSWWNSIQPTWRRSTVPNTLPLPLSSAKPNEDVCMLRKHGASGLVVVIASLAWW